MRYGILILLGVCLSGPALGYDWATNPGDGSAANPYQISTAEQLNSIGGNTALLNKCFILMNDIDMSAYTGTQYKIIGTNSSFPYMGIFDGNGFKVSHLTYTINNDTDFVGLFGYSKDAIIKNIHLDHVHISTKGSFVGGLIGFMSEGKIINASVTGDIVGNSYLGGLAGRTSGEITHCNSNCCITGVNAETWNNIIGGLAGGQNSGTITNCFCTGTITGYAEVGGLVGEQYGNVYQSFNQCNVIGIGTDKYGNPSFSIGGITGIQMGGTIKDCYNTGQISGYSQVGGITGWGALIQNCYNIGLISGYSETSGLSGKNLGSINSYWDIETSGISFNGSRRGRTTEQMKQAATYIGWNNDGLVWTLSEGQDYPRLAWERMAGDYLPVYFLSDYVPGLGEEWDPYRIRSAEQLNKIGLFPDTWDKVFVLEQDVDFAEVDGIKFNTIGVVGIPFSGMFDGKEYTISNFSYHTNEEDFFVGLFGYAYNATIKNVRLRDVNVYSVGGGIGGLVGGIEGNLSFIENCSVTGSVTGGSYVGGLIGGSGGSISNSTSHCSVSGDSIVGGLMGQQGSGTIFHCCSSGPVTGAGDSNECIGGLVGKQSDGTIYISFSTGDVAGKSKLGGLVGAQEQYMDFVLNYPFISNCYATGEVIGDDGGSYIGGLVGYQDINMGGAGIINSYSAGHVTGGDNSSYVGGFAGYSEENVLNCFWDVEASEQPTSAAGEGKTTPEMKVLSMYMKVGWDILGETQNGTEDCWAINANVNAGYPYLITKSLTQGEGTPENPYQISTPEELIMLGNDSSLWDKCFILVNDIDMSAYSGMQYNPIGNYFDTPFSGVFDGKGFKVSNLTCTMNEFCDHVGLFGFAEGATLRNLGVENVYLAGDIYVGGLAGYLSGGSITNCYSTGIVSGDTAGGLAGGLCECIITNSYSVGSVSAFWGGGMVGLQIGGMISGCFSSGEVTSISYVGGLVGKQYTGEINNCYSHASITCDSQDWALPAGGLVGLAQGSIRNCYSTGRISGNADPNFIGGLVGTGDTVSQSFWDIQSSGITHSASGTGLETELMMRQETFADWDFASVWSICDGTNYPRLQWQIPETDWVCPDGVGTEDLGHFAGRWLMDQCAVLNDCAGADLDASGVVDMADWTLFAGRWMEGN